ncbi:hypothetical protein FF38_13744 [Lucilia cuprina]|uniref:Uncharacterized protein n=1 Tax=Lucilia cuprina TaxID=7375 RepID=A0A0L0BSW9_LUCCU|nr:myotrophin-like isoform X2 [Lucilia cuprina]KNC23116.1 hypothetical protein FF38_13744 [Lucilia cuprina]
MSDLVWSIKNGELDQVQSLIREKSIDINSELNGRYPLHYAADYGQYDVLDYLISIGAKVNVTDKHEITPLLAAIWEGHTKCVQLLLEKGADKEGKTPDGSKYIDVAEKEEIRKLLL